MSGRRMEPTSWWGLGRRGPAVIVALCLLGVVRSASASSGSETYGTVDVSVTLPDRFDGGIGYRSAAVVLTNRGTATREVTLRMPARPQSFGESDYLTAVTRTFRVEPQRSLRAEMLIPPLPMNGQNVAVTIDDRRMRQDVRMAMPSRGYFTLSVLASRNVGGPVRNVLEGAIERHNDAVDARGWSSRGGLDAWRLALVVGEPVAQWSTSWQAYTSLAAVMIGEADLRAMPAAVASALRKYVLDGGRLFVVMDRDGTAWPPSWPVPAVLESGGLSPSRVGDGALSVGVGLGTVTWLVSDDVSDWSEARADGWAAEALRGAERRTRNMAAEDADRALPVIENFQTPVRGLLAVMVVFALLIGPANVLVLTWMKRRMWLLWTVPLIAAVFSAVVVVYALVSEGITPTARTQSVTWLDQTTRESVTVSMRGYYAPLTPGDGLRFGPNTAVIPQVGLQSDPHGFQMGGGGGGRTVDLTSGQHLSRGWVSARVPAYLELRTVETRRERLDFERFEDGGLAVVNGLGVDVDRLQVMDRDGAMWTSDGLAAGQRVELTPGPSVEERNAQGGRLEGFGLLASAPASLIGETSGWRFARDTRERGTAEPGTYVAWMSATPFVVDGMEGIEEHRVAAVVAGVWKEAE